MISSASRTKAHSLRHKTRSMEIIYIYTSLNVGQPDRLNLCWPPATFVHTYISPTRVCYEVEGEFIAHTVVANVTPQHVVLALEMGNGDFLVYAAR